MDTVDNEIVVKQSKTDKFVGYLFFPFGIISGLALMARNNILLGLVLLVVSPLLYSRHRKQYTNDTVLLKISGHGLWTRQGYKPWTKILKVKFRYVGSGSFTYLDIYRNNEFYADETIDVTSINLLKWNLKRYLKRHVKVE